MIENVTIGADPELFLINEKTGKVVSAIGIIPGEKGNAWVGPGMTEGFGLEIDNILAEFNIPPAQTKEEFTKSITFMLNYIDKFVKNINPDLGIKCTASQIVDEDQLQHPEAKRFGCSPDYCAYKEGPNKKPKGEKTCTRSAGFHVHIGYKNPNPEDSIELIKYMDVYLGIPSVVKDPDTQRRKLYGKAGAFRLCPYGCEYRVLSSYMLNHSDFVYEQAMKAINAYNLGVKLPSPTIVQRVINNSKVEEAKKLIEKYNLV